MNFQYYCSGCSNNGFYEVKYSSEKYMNFATTNKSKIYHPEHVIQCKFTTGFHQF